MVSEMLESKGESLSENTEIHMIASKIKCGFMACLLSPRATINTSACVSLSSMPVLQLYYDAVLPLVLMFACPTSTF